ncbi:MAG TPA: methylated-DNA--[protein]-cysteine S-methyltransferase [Micromonosporaceae bacterium]|jgi:methylated-DNA-[protein]-cysteine S-methyltransferase|nr:methylated-DNA--[protein]-cysteine S-methyltransferase [Micromonosporaceae bacterium]
MHSTTIDTPVGPFTIVGRGKAVLASGFTANAEDLISLITPATLHAETADENDGATDLTPAVDAARGYFDGGVAAIDAIEVEQHGAGAFLDRAWEVLREVPPGQTVTYREFAARAGRPTAIRAAASACARNAAALFVPCHRIVRADGGLGGYRYGLEIKEWLRSFEANISSADGETHS